VSRRELLGELLRNSRAKKGLSLRAAAEVIGTGFAHLCDMENGNHINPTARTIERLSAAYGIGKLRILKAAINSIEARSHAKA